MLSDVVSLNKLRLKLSFAAATCADYFGMRGDVLSYLLVAKENELSNSE